MSVTFYSEWSETRRYFIAIDLNFSREYAIRQKIRRDWNWMDHMNSGSFIDGKT
jgi:hypothetical protein